MICLVDSLIDCFSQALFNSLSPEEYKNCALVLGGDGRYFNIEAAQVSFLRGKWHLQL